MHRLIRSMIYLPANPSHESTPTPHTHNRTHIASSPKINGETPTMPQLLTQTPTGSVAFHADATALPSPGSGEVLVRLLAAPIHQLDLLVLANAYPVKPTFHHTDNAPIPGYDGVALVEACGPGDTGGLRPGDTVVPAAFGIGTWRTHALLPATALLKLATRPHDLATAALLRLAVAPAYCLVEDMVPLKPGDWVIQNAGASAIAQLVGQFAHRKGARVLSVVRDRDEAAVAAMRDRLLQRRGGVDAVLTESELESEGVGQGRRVVLALDAVHGASGRRLVEALAAGGAYVQLGLLGGGREPLPLDARDLFARRLTMKGFRGSAQLAARSEDEQRALFGWFVELFNAGELVAPPLGLERVEWTVADLEGTEKRVVGAVAKAQGGRLGQRKQILVFKH